MNIINKIYNHSPLFLQNTMISLYGYSLKKRRYGEIYIEQLKKFKERENYTKQQFRDYQTSELRKLLIHSYNTVPFYYKKYKEYGFNISKFEKFEIEDLEKLPFLEKEDLRKYGTTDLLSKKKQKGNFISTGGSTGTPAKIYYSNNFYQTWAAVYESRVRNWAGVYKDMSRGMIGGRNIITNPNAKPPYYRYNFAEKQTYFSAYHISEKNLMSYVEGIVKNKVDYMVGYALSNYFLADLIVKNSIKIPSLKSVLTSSEKLTGKMRITFEKAYGCKAFDAYSGVEACGLISENKFNELLWSPDVGIAEVVDENFNYKDEGELISTGLLNFDQPLIRYRIGDNVKFSQNQKSISDINMPIFQEILGRKEDVIITKDGRKIISMYRLFIDVPYVKLAQVVQNSYTDFEINLEVDNLFSSNEKQIIENRFFTTIDKDIKLTINTNKEIQRTKLGKYKLTISKINNV